MSIEVLVTTPIDSDNPTILASGVQYNYTRGELINLDSGSPNIEFHKTPLSKQSAQYAYTNENPVSMNAQKLIDSFPSDVNRIMLISGARNNVETKVFFSPRNSSYKELILYDDDDDVKVVFSGEDFQKLLNDEPNKFVSLVYTQASEDSSFELDLHTDETTYATATDYSSLDYLGVPNYPHYNQVKYSNRIVSRDDFISDSMSIRSSIEYTPHFGNYYIRPDFVKAFKGFKIIGKLNPGLTMNGDNYVEITGEGTSELYIDAVRNNIYYKELTWEYFPHLPGITMDVHRTSDTTDRATLIIDEAKLVESDVFTPYINITVTSEQGVSAEWTVTMSSIPSRSINPDVTIYVADPDLDIDPWYCVLDYITLSEGYRIRSDSYVMSVSNDIESYVELDQVNHRFRILPGFPSTGDRSLTWTYTPAGGGSGSDTTIQIVIADPIFSLNGTVVKSKLKVLDWIKCRESQVNIVSSDSDSCTLSSASGLKSIKAKTLHGTFLYREV